jgi:hypothetical protein
MGLEGLDLCGGGAGASVLSGMGTEKLVCAEGCCGEEAGDDDAPFTTGSRSTSIELLPLMAEFAKADKRLRSSGGRFRGWVSGSNLLLRREEDDDEDDGSVDCRESRFERDDLLLVSGWVECRELTGFLGERDCDFVGDEGSDRGCCESSRSSKVLGVEDEGFLEDGFLLLLLLPLPKNFIWARRY